MTGFSQVLEPRPPFPGSQWGGQSIPRFMLLRTHLEAGAKEISLRFLSIGQWRQVPTWVLQHALLPAPRWGTWGWGSPVEQFPLCCRGGSGALIVLSLFALVRLGRHKNTPQTGWLKDEMFISHTSGSWESKVKAPAASVPGDSALLACRRPPSCCVLTWPVHVRESSADSFSSYPFDLI